MKSVTQNTFIIRESSFNMTRGYEDIEGGLQKFLDTGGGGGGEEAPKVVYFKTNRRGGGLLKNWTASEGGC